MLKVWYYDSEKTHIIVKCHPYESNTIEYIYFQMQIEGCVVSSLAVESNFLFEEIFFFFFTKP